MKRTLRMTMAALGLASIALASAPVAQAQIESIDPDQAYGAEYDQGSAGSSWEESPSPYADSEGSSQNAPSDGGFSGNSGSYNAETPSDSGQQSQAVDDNAQWQDPYAPSGDMQDQPTGPTSEGYYQADPATSADVQDETTYQEDDLIGAAEGLFGKGAEGLAGMIESILKEQGRPNAYIVGREGGGALIFGLRYGSGTLFHKVEGQRPVYWTGPSVGFDAGAQAGNTFVLVYNLHDSEEIFQRFPAGEGAAYLVGGFNASYLRSGNIVMIPVRVGVGARLGVNVGYMKFSKKQNWFPF